MKYTYYYLNGDKVEKLTSIHEENVLKYLVPELSEVVLVKNKKMLPVPEGYIIKKGFVVPTKETANKIERERRELEARNYVFDSLFEILLCISGEKDRECLEGIVSRAKRILAGKE